MGLASHSRAVIGALCPISGLVKVRPHFGVRGPQAAVVGLERPGVSNSQRRRTPQGLCISWNGLAGVNLFRRATPVLQEL